MINIKINIIKQKTALILITVLLLSSVYNIAFAIDIAKSKYIKADAAYKKLRANPKKQKYRQFWFECINKYHSVYKYNPTGPWAAAGLYKSGTLYYELYKHSYKKSDKDFAVKIFQKIIRKYPKSRYQNKSKKALLQIFNKTAKHKFNPAKKKFKVPKKLPKISVKNIINTEYRNYISKKTKILNLRFWSNDNYTRIVIDADKKAVYNHKLLKKDPGVNKLQRLYIDLHNSIIVKQVPKYVSINDKLLKNVRVAQNKTDRVRVVIDIKSFKNYKIFSLNNPFRIVIDVWGKDSKKINNKRADNRKISNTSIKNLTSLAKQFALKVNTIVIDPGHGGKDYGAPGAIKGVHEKNIVLQISKKLAVKINKQLKCRTILTRKKDKYISLEERTAIANTKKADLFISIHTNAARNKKAYGIETYFLNLATDASAILVAERENATSAKHISDLQKILNDLMQYAKVNESSQLANYVQNNISSDLCRHYNMIKNKGVKKAPFYVLIGAQMPAVLIETGFISNKKECKRLMDPKYQNRLCDAIVKGLKKYIENIRPTAFKKQIKRGDFGV